MNQNDIIKSSLVQFIADYKLGIEQLGGDKKSQASKIATLRNSLASDPELVADCEAVVDSFLRTLQEATNDRGELLPALFNAIRAKLLVGIKDERDAWLTTETVGTSSSTSSVNVTELAGFRASAEAMFTAAQVLNVDLSDVPTKVSKRTGNVLLDIPGMPRNSKNRQAARAATHKFLWTINGTQFPNYSFAGIRKHIGDYVKVADIKTALDWKNFSSFTGDAISFDMDENGRTGDQWTKNDKSGIPDGVSFKRVTFKIVSALTTEEMESVTDTDDDDSGEDDDND